MQTLGASPPVTEHHSGAVMAVDVSGFTDLTDRLARLGQAGVDRIQSVLNQYFTALVNLVEQHGGIVVGFEGDSLTAGWRWTDEAQFRQVLARVQSCAEAVHERIGGEEFGADLRLRQRIAIGLGGIDILHLGEADRRRHVVLAGQAVDVCARLLVDTEAGETLISSEPRSFRASQAPSAGPAGESAPSAAKRRVPADYLPRVLRRDDHTPSPTLIGEIRTTTVLFVKVAAPDSAAGSGPLNDIVTLAQSAIDQQDGELLRITREGGDLSLLCVFGLPGTAHDNDAERAVVAAAEIRDALAPITSDLSIGIASGRAFCGPVGPAHRRDYTVHGPSVNAAARLCAVAGGRTYVDAATRTAIRSVAFSGPWMLRLAGIRRAVPAFLPMPREHQDDERPRPTLVDRVDERAVLRDLWRNIPASGPMVALVHGVPGIGKSALLAAMSAEAGEDDLAVLDGMADAMEQQTPYLAWRRVLRRCLEITGLGDDPVTLKERVASHLARCVGSDDFAPLLNDVLDLRIAETRLTVSMSDAVRADNLRRLLVAIIVERLRSQPHVLALDDVQWMDDASWALLMSLFQEAPPTLFVLACRREASEQMLLTHLSALPPEAVRDIGLEALEEDDVYALARHTMSGQSPPRAFAASLLDTSEGNPLYVEELCRMASADHEAMRTDLGQMPLSLESVILSRIDALMPIDQTVLRRASALGMRFARETLRSLPSIRGATDDFDTSIARILQSDLFRTAGAGQLAFRHQIVRDLVYSGMLSTQRSLSHAEAAEVLEAQGDYSGAEHLPAILAHWRAAGDVDSTVRYLEQVAALRLRQHDPAAAVALLDELFELIETADTGLPPGRLAICHLMRGRAMLNLGRMRASLESYETGLAMLGQPLPKGPRQLALHLLANTLRQLRPVPRGTIDIAGAPTDPSPTHAQHAFLHAAQAHETLTRIYYFSGDKGRLLLSALSAANCADRCGVSTPSQAVSYASLGAICGTIPLRRRAAAYIGRAEALAETFGDAGTRGRVFLLSGLYETSVGAWSVARNKFEAGLAAARRTGDVRLWYEHAVCLETICGPWLLTPAYAGPRDWDRLCREILDAGRRRNDMQVFACAALGYVRGSIALGQREKARELAGDLRSIVSDGQSEIEAIHRIEGLAHLADLALDDGDTATAMHWLSLGDPLLCALNARMKSRTLAALSLFSDAVDRAHSAGDGGQGLDLLRQLVIVRFRQFARVYPIGEPEAFRCRGDDLMRKGRPGAARRAWKKGLASAERLELSSFAARLSERLSPDKVAPKRSAFDTGWGLQDLHAPDRRPLAFWTSMTETTMPREAKDV